MARSNHHTAGGGIVIAGTWTEYSTLTAGVTNSYLSSIIVGPDNNLWFFYGGGWTKVGKMTTAGVLTVYTISQMSQLVSGPDGNIWGISSGSVIKINTSGTFLAAYASCPSATTTHSIAKGADGNIWVSCSDDDGINPVSYYISKITPAGVVTSYAASQYYGFIPGTDGNMWGVLSSNSVFKMTLAGPPVFTTYTAPAGNNSLGGIFCGPDNTLWFYCTNGTIGRPIHITYAGVWGGPYTGPTIGGTGIQGACAGPDGNLWFTEGSNARVFKSVAPAAGTPVEYTSPTASITTQGIVSGPDNRLWVTYGGTGNKIAAIS